MSDTSILVNILKFPSSHHQHWIEDMPRMGKFYRICVPSAKLVRDTTFENCVTNILFRFWWDTERVWEVLYLGHGFPSTFPVNVFKRMQSQDQGISETNLFKMDKGITKLLYWAYPKLMESTLQNPKVYVTLVLFLLT